MPPEVPDISNENDVSTTKAAESMLLEFVQGRDAECPGCGYNLRNLTKPVCPECREQLKLTVGLVKMRFGLFVITLVPCPRCIFSSHCLLFEPVFDASVGLATCFSRTR